MSPAISDMLTRDVAVALTGLLLLKLCMNYFGALRAIDHHPGLRSFLPKTSCAPRLWGFSPEKTVTWLEKYKVFENYGWDIISSTSVWPTASTAFFVADPGAIKEITTHRSKFPKLMTDYVILSLFGPNIVASEGLTWKKYRRVLAPAYSQENIMVVWEETFKVIHDLHQKWVGMDSVPVDNAAEFAFGLALQVISIAGFGIPLNNTVPPNHTLSFGEALRCVATDGFIKIAVPDWIPGFTGRIRKLRVAFTDLQKYMKELVYAKERGSTEFLREGSLLSNLVKASVAENSGDAPLTHDELFGNVFISFFAGHETTTHTLAFALTLLAIHPFEQELLYQQVRDVLNGASVLPWSSRAQLTRVSAFLNETLRMFPPITGLPKRNVNACVLRTCSAPSISDHHTVTIPQGSSLVIDIPGLHYNPKYWPEPHVFKPDRFFGSWCEDAFHPFSTGGRACLGRDFAETELLATLTSLVSLYKIELHPDLSGLDLPSLVEMLSDVKPGLSLCPKPLSLVFKKR